MDILNAYMQANRRDDNRVAAIECADGFTISVQGHYGAYCTPRVDHDELHGDSYKRVECGFPNAAVPQLAEWKNSDGDDKESVYAYVPVNVVIALLNDHGGIKK